MILNATVSLVAARFADNLRASIGDGPFETVRRRNRDNPICVCASHDFCDANLVMDAVFIDVFGETADFGADDHGGDLPLWNAAWGYARRNMLV